MDQPAERTAGSQHDHVHVGVMPHRGWLVAASGRSYADRVTGEELLRAVLAHPEDAARRLVYADYLQHHDDPQGELIALHCRLASLPAGDALRGDLDERARRADRCSTVATWAARLGNGVTHVQYQLGLAYAAQVIARANALDVLDRAPIRDLGFAPDRDASSRRDDEDVRDATDGRAAHRRTIHAWLGSRSSRPAWPGEPKR